MAHFAEIDENNIVIRVLVAPDEEEERGQDFFANDLGLGGTWIQTSYNNNIRKQYAGIGYKYDSDLDIFISPQPFPSWSLDVNSDWKAPKTKMHEWCIWNEEIQEWDCSTCE